MHRSYFSLFALLLFCNFTSYSQQPVKPTSSELYNQIKKLNFLGSVLYLAAHPDDENTRLISYFANEKNYRTGYLSLTRGDGGQNLIGPELRELLGAIRTQELLEARKIDGGEQFFSRANDFGYSKNPVETLEFWEKDKVLSDVIWQIRKFRPDVIVNRFDHRSPGTTHGHHTASAMLSVESFDKSNDAKLFPEQLKYVQPWQPKRMFFNTSWWFYGSQEKFEQADKSNLVALQTGVYYETIGKSNQEIAALSRSRHQSQGFGSTGVRGEENEYLELIKGDMPLNKQNLFEGIDTSWNRVNGGKPIGELLALVEQRFDFKNPSASIPDLVKAYAMIQKLDDDHWKFIKSEEIQKIIAGCAGLFLEAVANTQDATPGTNVKLKLEAINRSDISMKLVSVKYLPQSNEVPQTLTLDNNIKKNIDADIILPANLAFTQPYWLNEPGSLGMYRVDNQLNIGVPDIIRELKVRFNVEINGVTIPFERNVIYKYNDDVKGEVYRPFDVIPEVTSAILNKVVIFNNGKSQSIAVKVKSGKESIKGKVTLELPKTWKITPAEIPFSIDKKNAEEIVYFEVTPPANAEESVAKSIVTIDGKRFDKEKTELIYEHISKQQILKTAEAKFIRLDIKTNNERIAYIMGAGDEVPKSLAQMGYSVTILKPEEILKDKLANFDVVMTGIRAYNVVQGLGFKQDILFDFIKEGKTMIVQYNTLDDLVTSTIAPFPLKLSRDRVTEENAEVRFLVPDAKVLNSPNKITAKDFQGWKQEQGLYYPNQWDNAFTPILSANDKDEKPKNGALLVANYGKGHYIYTGLSFFRELPEGVAGAYRLMANLISAGKK